MGPSTCVITLAGWNTLLWVVRTRTTRAIGLKNINTAPKQSLVYTRKGVVALYILLHPIFVARCPMTFSPFLLISGPVFFFLTHSHTLCSLSSQSDFFPSSSHNALLHSGADNSMYTVFFCSQASKLRQTKHINCFGKPGRTSDLSLARPCLSQFALGALEK